MKTYTWLELEYEFMCVNATDIYEAKTLMQETILKEYEEKRSQILSNPKNPDVDWKLMDIKGDRDDRLRCIENTTPMILNPYEGKIYNHSNP